MSYLDLTARGSHIPTEHRPVRVLVVDGGVEATDAVLVAVGGVGHEVAVLGDAGELRAALEGLSPDLVIVAAATTPHALALLAELDAMPPPRAPVVVVTAAPLADDDVGLLLRIGADDVVTCVRHRPAELQGRVARQLGHKEALDALRRVRGEREELRREAHTDALTGAWNRRAIEAHLERRVQAGDVLGVLFVDVDHFKRINDVHGHDVGDAVLVGLARMLAAAVRPGDMVGRLGGEEFVVLTAGTDESGAFAAAERLRRLVADGHGCLELPAVTVSVGVAVHAPGAGVDADELVRRADAAVYEAKRRGRDRVVPYSAELPVARTSARRASGTRPIALPVEPPPGRMGTP